MIKPANGSNGHHAPPWAKELSADVRASLRSAAEDRNLFQAQLAESIRKSEEDRRQAAADRRRYAEDSARRHKEFMGALQVIGRVAVKMQREQKRHTGLLEHIARAQENQTRVLHDMTHILHDVARSLHVRGNGRRNGGNGRGNGNGKRKQP
jgi:hypothetical protein